MRGQGWVRPAILAVVVPLVALPSPAPLLGDVVDVAQDVATLVGIPTEGPDWPSPPPAWARVYDGPAGLTDWANSIALSPDDRTVVVTGWSQSGTLHAGFATAAYDAADGALRWVARYEGASQGWTVAQEVLISHDGATVFVTGWTPTGPPGPTTDRDYATVAYDLATGRELWVALWDGTGGTDVGHALVLSPDGGTLYVTGASDGGDLLRDFGTIALDARTGALVWEARYEGPAEGWDDALRMAISPDGARVFVTGPSQGEDQQRDFATVAYDAVTGAELWVARYSGDGAGWDESWGVAVSPDNRRVYISGRSNGEGTAADFATIAYDAASGGELWATRYNTPWNGYDSVHAMAMTPDGSVVVATGRTRDVDPVGTDFFTVAHRASDGAVLWTAMYAGPGGGSDFAAAAATSRDGTMVFVTGPSSGGHTGDDIATVAYDVATGQELAVWRHDCETNPGWDIGTSLVPSADGARLYVAGRCRNHPATDFITLAYDVPPAAGSWEPGPRGGDR